VDVDALSGLCKPHVGLELGELGVLRVPPGNRVPHALQEHTQMELFLLTHTVLLTVLSVGWVRRHTGLPDAAGVGARAGYAPGRRAGRADAAATLVPA